MEDVINNQSPFLVLLVVGAIGFMIGSAIDPDEIVIHIMTGLAAMLAFLILYYLPNLKDRGEKLEAAAQMGGDRVLLCEKAKKIAKDMEDLNPIFAILKPEFTDLYKTLQTQAVSICTPEDTSNTTPEDTSNTTPEATSIPTLESLYTDLKAVTSIVPDKTALPKATRQAVITGLEKMSSNVCAPFDKHKGTYDEANDTYKEILLTCGAVPNRLVGAKKIDEFNTQAGIFLKKHPLLMDTDTSKAYEYAKTNKDTLATDGGEICKFYNDQTMTFVEDTLHDDGVAGLAKIVRDATVDICKKTV
jgi:hypothetical protein